MIKPWKSYLTIFLCFIDAETHGSNNRSILKAWVNKNDSNSVRVSTLSQIWLLAEVAKSLTIMLEMYSLRSRIKWELRIVFWLKVWTRSISSIGNAARGSINSFKAAHLAREWIPTRCLEMAIFSANCIKINLKGKSHWLIPGPLKNGNCRKA